MFSEGEQFNLSDSYSSHPAPRVSMRGLVNFITYVDGLHVQQGELTAFVYEKMC